MNYQNRKAAHHLPLKASVIAIAIAFSSSASAVFDEDLSEETLRLITPGSEITLGVGSVSGDNQRFGTYNGLHKQGYIGLGEFSIVRRDESTGTWFRSEARNLGIPQAEFRIEHERQGQWRYFAEFDQITRYTPYDVRSRLQGGGSHNLSYANTSGQQTVASNTLNDLHTERLGAKLGFTHLFNSELELRFLFQNQEKKGERLFGRGTGGAQEFLIEPIDSTTRQLDLLLNYTGERLQLSGGYYGSWYQNANSQLNVAGGDAALRTAAGPAIPFSVIALAPDNFAHQFHLTGGYQFTDRTRGTFKLSHTNAYQTDGFVGVPGPTSGANPAGGLNLSGRSDLGGRIETTLVNLGVSSRPNSDLSLLGNFRYEDRHDRTPVVRYITVTSTTSTTDGFNEPRSLKVISGKLEASYQLPAGFRATGGIDLEQKEHSMAGVRVVGYRDRTDEVSYRAELSKALADELSGSLSFIHSNRDGSDYRNLQTWNATTGTFNSGTSYSNRLQPIYIGDRKRDKIRLLSDWSPVEPLTLQFGVESSRDNYGAGRDSLDIGPRQGSAQLYSIDAAWSINDAWRLNSWVSRSVTSMDQATGNSVATLWTSGIVNRVQMIGAGLRGKLTSRIDVGADLTVAHDRSTYNQGGAAASSPLPDITYDQTTFKLFGRYALSKDIKLRLDYIRDHRKTDDWTWNGTASSGPYVYTDGTVIFQNPNETVHFLGISVSYAFR
ncbi:MAG: MtrB/PioB family decaheme-associated outer membrane protein [Rhodocyclales bacterium GT-UBC]|nr:MAG: MtrB/PioB family decaheme-associated outer membrane protein [Rhodocyclales bacterium GT-UBC]